MRGAGSSQLPSRLALHSIAVPKSQRILTRVLLALMATTAVALTVTPWQQNVTGSGRVLAFRPEERPQNIDAPVEGRIAKWYVVEGSTVKKGDPIVDLSDNDPSILERLGQERTATSGTISAGQKRVQTIEDRIRGLETTLKTGVSAARARVEMAVDRVAAAEQSLEAARSALVTAKLQIERQRGLAAKGLTSTRNVELAELDLQQKTADVERSTASLSAAKNERISLEAELLRVDADSRSRIDEAWGSHASAVSDTAKAQVEMTKVEVRLARQSTQRVTAPMDGTVFRVVARQSGELLKSGDLIGVLVPRTVNNVVELLMDGNDVPLISPGRNVRLQFEGWPALQFSGWPSIAVGTFGGRVLLVDSTDNGQGKFRVLVEADPRDEAWPGQNYLRQGVRANGWILLDQVPLGYELWRQFNGFPPVIAQAEPDSKEKK
ncbi:MAG: HlyD family secretion protein [Bryobacteraceae bacterium]